MGVVHINWTNYSKVRLARMDCPTCERRTFGVHAFQEWYGWDSTCLGCGDSWQDGEMLERPFRPRWREESKAAARELYRREAQRGTAT